MVVISLRDGVIDDFLLGVMLARLRMSHVAIRDAVLGMDDSKLSIDDLKALKQHAPTAAEVWEAESPYEPAKTTVLMLKRHAHRERPSRITEEMLRRWLRATSSS
jgi:hypothetical protein